MIILNENKRAKVLGSLMVNQTILKTVKELNVEYNVKERLLFISAQFSKMYEINYRKQFDNDNYDEFVNIQVSADKLREIFSRDYTMYLNILKDLGFLSWNTNSNNNKSYSNIKNECTIYHWNEPNGLVTEVAITAKNIFKNFYIFSSKNDKYLNLINNYKVILHQIQIDDDIINDLSIEGLKSINDDFDVENLLKKQIKDLNKLRTIVSKTETNYVVIDDFSERLHTQITNLSKNYRKYLKIDGKKLVEIDIVNSQPWLASLVIDDEQFNKDCIDGVIYQKLMMDCYERDKVKKCLYFIMFGGWQVRGKGDTKFLNNFKTLYPKAQEKIEELNKDDHKNLARLLQKTEANLMIKNVWSRLFDNKIKSLTIHDSIMIKEEDLEQAKNILEEEILKSGYELPKIKITYN